MPWEPQLHAAPGTDRFQGLKASSDISASKPRNLGSFNQWEKLPSKNADQRDWPPWPACPPRRYLENWVMARVAGTQDPCTHSDRCHSINTCPQPPGMLPQGLGTQGNGHGTSRLCLSLVMPVFGAYLSCPNLTFSPHVGGAEQAMGEDSPV